MSSNKRKASSENTTKPQKKAKNGRFSSAGTRKKCDVHDVLHLFKLKDKFKDRWDQIAPSIDILHRFVHKPSESDKVWWLKRVVINWKGIVRDIDGEYTPIEFNVTKAKRDIKKVTKKKVSDAELAVAENHHSLSQTAIAKAYREIYSVIIIVSCC